MSVRVEKCYKGLTLQTKLFCRCKVGSKVFLPAVCGFRQFLSANNVDCLAELCGGGDASRGRSSSLHGRGRFVDTLFFLSCMGVSDMSGTSQATLRLTQSFSELWVVAANIIKVYGIASESNEERDRRRGDNSRRRRHWQGRRHVRDSEICVEFSNPPLLTAVSLFCDQRRDSTVLVMRTHRCSAECRNVYEIFYALSSSIKSKMRRTFIS